MTWPVWIPASKGVRFRTHCDALSLPQMSFG
jgi:hypothetical protein